jgi:hypothetical protein
MALHLKLLSSSAKVPHNPYRNLLEASEFPLTLLLCIPASWTSLVLPGSRGREKTRRTRGHRLEPLYKSSEEARNAITA